MIGIKVKLTGLAPAVAKYKNASPKIRSKIKEVLNDVGKEFYAEARARTPVATGTAREAIELSTSFGSDITTRVAVSADLEAVPYWEYIEYGAPPHEIDPIDSNALAFEMNGERVFAKHVNHPGSPAQYIFGGLQEEWKDRIQEYIDRVTEEIKKLFE